MGTERDLVFEDSCICGKGKFQVESCSPDHPWGGGFWSELFIDCKYCKQSYELQQQGNNIVVVAKSEILQRNRQAEEANRRWKELLKNEDVKIILRELSSLLDRQRSVAAIHRLLVNAGIEHSSISTFRKDWESGKKWIERNVYYSKLMDIMKLLNKSNDYVASEILAIAKLSSDSRSVPPPLGKPIYKV